MAIAQVKITYKQSIDSNGKTEFEKAVFEATFYQFIIKSRVYNAENVFVNYRQMLENDHRASSLNHKLNAAIKHLIDQLQGKIPILKDTLGREINFSKHQLQLLDSDLQDRSAHCISIDYTTGSLILHQIMGEYLLLSISGNEQDCKDEASTFMLKMQPDVAISSYQEYKSLAALDFTGFAAN